MSYSITEKDRQILRELARKQLYMANQESNLKKMQEWYLHNDLKGERPMIHLELGTFQNEVIPKRLRCETPFARSLETRLYDNFINQEIFDDDKVTPDYFGMGYDSWFTLFNIPIKIEHIKGDAQCLGHHFVSQIGDLEEDYEKLGETDFGVNLESTNERKAAIEEIFGDILPVKLTMGSLYSVPTQMLVHFMSMEQMFMNMMDYPELFLQMMDRIVDDTNAYYRMLEEKQLILPTTECNGVGNGTFAFTNELPKSAEELGRPLTSKDVWGFMDSQETVGISSQMFEELIFPCYQKIAKNYGLMSYGCCEPVDFIWDNCLSKLDNLRKVSISPWCNEEFMGERLRGSKVIYHRKPSPNYLGVDRVLDEEAFRSHIRKTLEAARGCKLEFSQRDVYTIHNSEEKARRYVAIIREEIENHWKN